MALSITEQLCYSTVRIECEYHDGRSGTGTGFLFKFLEADNGAFTPVLITNKHVIEGARHGKLVLTTMKDDGGPNDTVHLPIEISNFEIGWRKHPHPEVDLCAMPFGAAIQIASEQGKKLFYKCLDKSILPTQMQLREFSAMEEIVMIGYPNGIWDNINNKPIFRRGITATHPNFDYCGQKEIMIDAACFPGSSGSPVFIFNGLGYQEKTGAMIFGKSRLILLGILYGGPVQSLEGEVSIEMVPTSQKQIATSHIPINLGLIIKAERILELEEIFQQEIINGRAPVKL